MSASSSRLLPSPFTLSPPYVHRQLHHTTHRRSRHNALDRRHITSPVLSQGKFSLSVVVFHSTSSLSVRYVPFYIFSERPLCSILYLFASPILVNFSFLLTLNSEIEKPYFLQPPTFFVVSLSSSSGEFSAPTLSFLTPCVPSCNFFFCSPVHPEYTDTFFSQPACHESPCRPLH
jgi:hypothetical protein